MTIAPFELGPPLIGGALIGLAASLLLAANGRIAGISGIIGELIARKTHDHVWRAAFLAGLALTGVVILFTAPQVIVANPARSLPIVILGGVIVGYGTRMGNGCTSGHGVCGIPRGSMRSIVATVVFMATGALTVGVIRAFGGVL